MSSASTLVPTSLAQRLLSTIAAVALVLGLVRVGPLAPSTVQAASGEDATVRLTLEGPDTFGASIVATGTRAVGAIFPVSVIIDTDGAAVNSFALKASFTPADFHIVDPTTGADITSFPNNAQTKGSAGLLFQGAASFPGAGPTNIIDNTVGSAVIAYGASPSDTDTQIYSQTDTAATTGYHLGSDRVMTMYFKAMRAVTAGSIGFAADTPTTTQQLIRYGDWMNVGTASEEDIYVDADVSGTVTTGDVRLTAVGTLAAGTTAACAADADCGTSLAGGRLAGAMYRDTASNSTFDIAADPVYINLDYPNTAVSTDDLRVLPTGLTYTAGSPVVGADTDAGGALLPLSNVRQTGSGGTLTDLVGTAGVSLVGVTVTGTPPTSAITTASKTCVQSNGTDSVTVTVTTTPVMQGVPVTLTSSDMTGLTITPVAPLQNATTAQTNASGVATFTVTGTSAGARTFTGTAGGVTATPSASVTFQAGACGGVVSATTSTVVAAPTCVASNGATPITITVTALSSTSSPVSGATVTLAQGSGSSVITPATATTNASGVATFSVVNTTAEAVTYTATVNGTVITQTATVNFAMLAACYGISGTVTGTTNAVTISRTGASTGSATSTGGATNSYTMTGLAAGTYTLTPSAVSGCTTPVAQTITITSANQTVNFNYVCSGTTTLTLSPACVVANGTNTNVNLVFTGTGTTGAPVSNINVTPSSNLTVSPTSGTTSGSGQLSTTINITSGAALGARTLYATINSSTVSASLNVVSTSAGCGTSGTGALATSTKTATNRDKIFKAGNSVDFTLLLRNTNTASLTDVSVLDTKDRGWDSFNTSSITVSPSSGTASNTSSQISLSNVTVAGSSSTSVLYTQKLKSGSNLLDDLDIDQAADPKVDTDWWAENVVSSEVQSSDYDNEDDVLDVSDTSALSLGGSSDALTDDLIYESDLDSDSSYVIVDFGDRVIVNTSGDDFFIKEQNASDDTDSASEKYAVYASQDGVSFSLISKSNTGSKTFDLGKSDYDWAKQILIVDQTKDSSAKGKHPGIDIESIGVIHLGGLVKNTATISSASVSSTANPSETIAVDVTSIMDKKMEPCAFGIGANCSSSFSTVYSSVEGDPCYSLAGGNVTFTLRDLDNVVVPNQAITITALPADGVTIQTSPSTTDANGRITVRVASSKVQDVVFTFSATPSGSTTPMSVLTYTGVFKTSCSTLPKTGPGVLTAGLLVVSALPAAWVARRRWLEV